MLAAFDGKPVDVLPTAPFFCGAEYVWKLVGKPIWEVQYGDADTLRAVLDALDRRHGCDWIVPCDWIVSSELRGKTLSREDPNHVYFTDDQTGEEFFYHKQGHWLAASRDFAKWKVASREPKVEPSTPDVRPPANKAEADDWLARKFPPLFAPPIPHVVRRDWRERFPDRFLCGTAPNPFASLAFTLGLEQTLFMLIDNPSLAVYLIEKSLTHFPAACAGMALDGFDGAMMTDSWASADIMSPEIYSNWIAPMHRRVSDELHRAGLRSVMYNTGNVLPMLKTLGTLGFDGLQFEERIKGVEMDIAALRQGVGADVCLFANFDSYLLLRGDRAAIRDEVRRHVRDAGPWSLVMGAGSPICDGTDPDTIDFWLNEARSVGLR